MPGYTEALSESRPISSWKADHGSARAVRAQGSGGAQPASRMAPSGAEAPLVIVVDDDEAVRLALVELMESVELDAVSFGSTRELLEADLPDRPGCLVLDVRMPGLSGLDLQNQLASSGDAKPVIFVSGHGDIPMTVQAMKAGAIDFLTKPVRGQAVLDAVKLGIERDIAQRAVTRIIRTQANRFATLTARERQVMKEVARGRLNKQIAFDLGISQITVKVHRANMMRKMQTTSVGELVRAWEALPAQLRADRPAEHRI